MSAIKLNWTGKGLKHITRLPRPEPGWYCETPKMGYRLAKVTIKADGVDWVLESCCCVKHQVVDYVGFAESPQEAERYIIAICADADILAKSKKRY